MGSHWDASAKKITHQLSSYHKTYFEPKIATVGEVVLTAWSEGFLIAKRSRLLKTTKKNDWQRLKLLNSVRLAIRQPCRGYKLPKTFQPNK